MIRGSMSRLPGHTGRAMAGVGLVVVALLAVLAGCSDKKDKDKGASQTAARVNKEDITVHQINYVLQQQRGLAPAQAASASKQVLERLVDQELALQKAQDQKLDRDPRVVQQLEAARREIIARGYVDKISAGAPKPAPAEIKAYYVDHPGLFAQRRVYNLQELSIPVAADQVPELQAKLAASKDLPEFIAYLREKDYKFTANQAVRGAEQLPMAVVPKLAQMNEGQTVFTRTPTGAEVVAIAGVRSQPVDEARAAPAIEQFLWNERKKKLVEDDIRALRSAAKIEYMGEYAKGGAREITAPAPAASEAPPLTSILPPQAAGSAATAAPQFEVAPIVTAPSTAPASGVLESGMKGFK